MINKIPPKFLYPGIVVMILGLSVLANVVLIVKASNDQGPQIIENYYQQAVNYNDVIAEREETRRLGWTTKVMWHRPSDKTTRQIDFLVFDANKKPLQGAIGSVELFNPAKAAMLGSAELRQINDGMYSVTIKGEGVNRRGLYDIILHLEHDGSHYTKTIRERM